MDTTLAALHRARTEIERAIAALSNEPRSYTREPWANTPERNALIDNLAKDIIESWRRPVSTMELAECLAINRNVALSAVTLRLQVLPKLRDMAGTWTATYYDRATKRYSAPKRGTVQPAP